MKIADIIKPNWVVAELVGGQLADLMKNREITSNSLLIREVGCTSLICCDLDFLTRKTLDGTLLVVSTNNNIVRKEFKLDSAVNNQYQKTDILDACLIRIRSL